MSRTTFVVYPSLKAPGLYDVFRVTPEGYSCEAAQLDGCDADNLAAALIQRHAALLDVQNDLRTAQAQPSAWQRLLAETRRLLRTTQRHPQQEGGAK